MLKAGALIGATVVVGCAALGDGEQHPPVWNTVPDQIWVVGVPVHLDLADYCSDEDLEPMTFILSDSLPPGVTLDGSVISGTPTAAMPTTSFVAMADDGQ